MRAQDGAAEIDEDEDAVRVVRFEEGLHDAHGVGADGVVRVVNAGGGVDSLRRGAHLRGQGGDAAGDVRVMRDEDEVNHGFSGWLGLQPLQPRQFCQCLREEVIAFKQRQVNMAPARVDAGAQCGQRVVNDGGAVAWRLFARGEVEGFAEVAGDRCRQLRALAFVQENRPRGGDFSGKRRRRKFAEAACNHLVGAGGVVVGSCVDDADFRRDGDNDADMRVFAAIKIADQRAFPPGAGTKNPVADGKVFRGNRRAQLQRQEDEKEQEALGFHAGMEM